MEQIKSFKYQNSYYSKYNPEYRNRLKDIKRKYTELQSLRAVALHFHISQERVRQLLHDGEDLKLFSYQTREKRRQQIAQTISKEQVLDGIEGESSFKQLAKGLKVTLPELQKLFTQYNITKEIYNQQRLLRRKQFAIDEYLKIVDILGHHPTTTEMNIKPSYRSVWCCIYRLWGNVENFRKEQNITINNNLDTMHTANHYYGIKRILKVIDFLKTQEPPMTQQSVVQAKICSQSRVYRYFNRLVKLNIISRQKKSSGYVLNHQNIYLIMDEFNKTAKKLINKTHILNNKGSK